MTDIKKTVKNTILSHKLINRGDYVLLGLSGGPDSLCLLHVLLDLKSELGFEMSAVHVNHGIRGQAADEDAMWVSKYCNRIGVSCTRVESNVPLYAEKLHLTEEEAGRRVRREIFAYMAYGLIGENVHAKHPAWPLRNAYKGPGGIKAVPGAVRIALAHNLDDQAETVMMRILRGTGVHGLTGIQYQSPLVDALQRVGWGIRNPLLQQNAKDLDISIIRPLLDVPRTEIENYCTENQLQPRIDHTNQETDYTRNRIRLELLPMLAEKFNPNIKETLVRLAANAAEDDEALAAQASAASRKAEKILSVAAFAAPDPAETEEAEPTAQSWLKTSASAQARQDSPADPNIQNTTAAPNIQNTPADQRLRIVPENQEHRNVSTSADQNSKARDPRLPRPVLNSITLDAAALRALQPAVFKRLITLEFDKLGLSEGISAVHLNALYGAVQKNIGGKTIEFPGGHSATLRAGTLTLQ